MRTTIALIALLAASPVARDRMVPLPAKPRPPTPSAIGIASWYGPGFDGRLTASGVVFRAAARTAAHRTLPFGTIVVVRDEDTGRSVEVVINDRGPFADDRLIDLSEASASELGMTDKGLARVALFVKGARL